MLIGLEFSFYNFVELSLKFYYQNVHIWEYVAPLFAFLALNFDYIGIDYSRSSYLSKKKKKKYTYEFQ